MANRHLLPFGRAPLLTTWQTGPLVHPSDTVLLRHEATSDYRGIKRNSQGIGSLLHNIQRLPCEFLCPNILSTLSSMLHHRNSLYSFSLGSFRGTQGSSSLARTYIYYSPAAPVPPLKRARSRGFRTRALSGLLYLRPPAKLVGALESWQRPRSLDKATGVGGLLPFLTSGIRKPPLILRPSGIVMFQITRQEDGRTASSLSKAVSKFAWYCFMEAEPYLPEDRRAVDGGLWSQGAPTPVKRAMLSDHVARGRGRLLLSPT